MIEFLYNAGTALSLQKIERTFQLLLRDKEFTIELNTLYGARLWVVIEEKGRYLLYAVFRPLSLETIQTELEESCLVVNADVMQSAYFLSDKEIEKNVRYDVTSLIVRVTDTRLGQISKNVAKDFSRVFWRGICPEVFPACGSNKLDSSLSSPNPRLSNFCDFLSFHNSFGARSTAFTWLPRISAASAAGRSTPSVLGRLAMEN